MTTLSGSSVAAYEECHLAWYFEYVEKRPARSDAMDLGQYIHDYAETMLNGGTEHGFPDGAPLGEILRLCDVFDQEILPTYGNAVLVEAGFELDVEGVTYTGFIDSVDIQKVEAMMAPIADFDEATTIVRDLKTTKNRPRPGKYRDPVVGYYLGAREMGYEADLIRLDYIVKTQRAYYWPEDQEVPDEDEIDVWAAKVVRVHRSIEEGDWEATGVGTYVCGFCPFNTICGPYERWQELTSPLRKG